MEKEAGLIGEKETEEESAGARLGSGSGWVDGDVGFGDWNHLGAVLLVRRVESWG